MAQTGFTPIQLYYSTTATNIPSAANLVNGELALNVADMKLYAKNGSGVVTLLASSSGAIATVSSVNVSGGTTGLTFSGGPITTSGTITMAGTLDSDNGGTGQNTYAAGDTLFYASGTALSKLTIGATNRIMTSSGTAPQWTDPATITVGFATAAGTAATTNPLTMNDSGTGAASGTTFNGSVAQTISYNTIGAPKADGTGASGTWGINITGSANAVANSITFNTSGGASPGVSFNGSAARAIDYSTVGAPKADGTGASGTWGINISGSAVAATTATNLAGGALDRIPVQTSAGTTTFITAPTAPGRYLYWDNVSGFQWLAGAGTGTVTSVNVSGGTTGLTFSGGPVTSFGTITMSGVLDVDNGGTGLTSGTSGGVPYFSATNTIASSNVLAANQIVLGGGAGVAPATTTTGTGVVTAIGNNTNSASGFAVLNASGLLNVAQGGTGAATLTANNVILGNGTSAVQFVAPGSSGNALISNGTTWSSQALISGAQGFITQATGSNQPPGAFSPSDSFALI